MSTYSVRRLLLRLAILTCLLVQGGCGTAGLSLGNLDLVKKSKLQSASGLVKLGTELIKDALVTLTPEEFPGEKNVFFVAQSDADGKYELQFKWSRYRHYTLKAVYTAEGDPEDTADDKIYTGAVHLDPLEYEPLVQDIDLVLQATPPAGTFVISGVIQQSVLLSGTATKLEPVPGALVMIQPAVADDETPQSYLDRTGPDGSYWITVPYYPRRYQIQAVWPANADPASGEKLLVGMLWLEKYAEIPDEAIEQNLVIAEL